VAEFDKELDEVTRAVERMKRALYARLENASIPADTAREFRAGIATIEDLLLTFRHGEMPN
jgi:hypothetical protein